MKSPLPAETVFDRPTLISALGELLQNAYTTQRVNTMQHNLEFYFKLHGYYAAQVAVAGEPKKATPGPLNNRRVPVTFTIQSGALYRFDGVTIKGLDRLHPSFIENRFHSLTGQIYTPTALDERYREVLRTGLFRNLKVATVPLPTNEVRVDLTGEEAKAKEIGFSVGFSTYEGILLGVRLADRDFMGRGRPLSLDIDYTSRSMRSELLYVDPWLFESNYALRARIFIQSRTEIDYTKEEEGVRLDLTRKFNPHYEAGAFFSIRNVNITDSSVQPQFLGPTSYQIATIGLTQTFDYRDSPGKPQQGLDHRQRHRCGCDREPTCLRPRDRSRDLLLTGLPNLPARPRRTRRPHPAGGRHPDRRALFQRRRHHGAFICRAAPRADR